MRSRGVLLALLSLLAVPGCGRRSGSQGPPKPCSLVVGDAHLLRYETARKGFVALPSGAEIHGGDLLRTAPDHDEVLQAADLSLRLGAGTSCTVQHVEGSSEIPDIALCLEAGTLLTSRLAAGRVTVGSFGCRAVASQPGSQCAVEVHEDADRFTTTRFACLEGSLEVFGPRRKEPPVVLQAGTELVGDDGGLKVPAPLGSFQHAAFGPPSPLPGGPLPPRLQATPLAASPGLLPSPSTASAPPSRSSTAAPGAPSTPALSTPRGGTP